MSSSGLAIGWANTSRDWRHSSVKVAIYSTLKCVSEIKKNCHWKAMSRCIVPPPNKSITGLKCSFFQEDPISPHDLVSTEDSNVYTQFMICILWDLCDSGALFSSVLKKKDIFCMITFVFSIKYCIGNSFKQYKALKWILHFGTGKNSSYRI